MRVARVVPFLNPDGTNPAYLRACRAFMAELEAAGASADDIRGILAGLLAGSWTNPLTLEELLAAVEYAYRYPGAPGAPGRNRP